MSKSRAVLALGKGPELSVAQNFGAIRCNTVQYGAIRCNSVQFGAIWCNTVQRGCNAGATVREHGSLARMRGEPPSERMISVDHEERLEREAFKVFLVESGFY